MKNKLARREFLVGSTRWTAAVALSHLANKRQAFAADGMKLPVAGITTIYRQDSHADVILGKILEGYNQQGGPGPNLKLVSMYVDQTPDSDLSRRMSEKHGVPIFDTIDDAITLGGDHVAVAGVLSIGEHGDYPYFPETHQHMYPRRRFFDEIATTFQKYSKSVPVFSDKHLSWNWKDTKHIYDTARRMQIPLMAGSSIPVTWRRPGVQLPMHCQLKEAVAIGYGGLESYGFHALEGLQCMVERRRGGETGIESVQALRGDRIWKAAEEGRWSRSLAEAALATQPGLKLEDWEKRLNDSAAVYLVKYRDGLQAAVLMANGVAERFGFAAQVKGEAKPFACTFMSQQVRPYGHFSYLLKSIEHMVHTGQPAYPVERTLLTTGVLDRTMQSLARDQREYATPELKTVKYQALNWPFAKTKLGVPPH